MVDPTATETSTFTAPPVYTTVGVRRIFAVRITDTRVFTATTTVTEISEDLLSASTEASVDPAATDAPSVTAVASSESLRGGSQSNTTLTSTLPSSAAVDAPDAVTSPPTVTVLGSSGSVASNSSSPVVTAIPFSCPDAAGKRVEQVVDGVRLDYLVLCNTQLVTADRRRPVPVDSETECAAQCSLINTQTGQDTCQATSYEPNADGSSGGLCTVTTDEPEYVDSPGSIAIVHTGTLANGDECANINSPQSSSSIDTAAAIAAVTSAAISVSTPGLVTQSANGGVFQTYVSANSTDASGYVHWSWYAVSASSSFWWAVYSTSWECTATLTRTIVQQPAAPQTILSVQITTIVHGATTTYISGTSTRIVTNGDGVIPPTFVPASTTEGDGGVTTFFSEATVASTAQSGLASPSNEGPGNATVSFATSTYFSTGSEGVIPPTSVSPSAIVETIVSSGGTLIATSGSTYTSNGNGSAGIISPVPSTGGSAIVSVGGSTFTFNSTGSGGIVTPVIETRSSSVASLTIQEVSNSTLISGGTAVLTLSGSTGTAVSTGDTGVISPSPPRNATVTVTVSVTSGAASFATSSSTFVSNGSSDAGVLPPASVTTLSNGASFAISNSTLIASSTFGSGIIPPVSSALVTPPLNQTVIVVSSTGGNGNITVASSTAVSSGTGDSGIIPPPITNISSLPLPSVTPGLEVNISVSVGTAQFSTSNGTIVVASSSASGVIPPSLSNVTITTTTTTVTGSTVAIPSVDISSNGGGQNFSIQGSTGTFFSTGSGGIITPSGATSSPSSNATSTTPSSTGPPFSNTGDNRSPFPFTRSSSSSRVSAGPSGSLNVSSTSTGPPFSNTGNNRSPFPITHSSTTRVSNSVASTGVLVPSSNSSVALPSSSLPLVSLNSSTFSRSSQVGSSPVTLPPSATPTASSNVSSVSTGPPFSNTGDNRSPFPIIHSSSTRVSTGLSVSLNVSSTSTGPPFSNTGDNRSPFPLTHSSSTGLSTNSSSVTPNTFTTTATVTIVPSSSFPPASSNATTSDIFSSTAASSIVPSPSANSTSSFSTPVVGSSSVPPLSANSTASAGTSSSSLVPSSSLPAPSSNGTTSAPPDVPTIVPPPFGGNSTVPTGTGFTVESFGTPVPSLNSTLTLPLSTSNVTSFGPSATPSISSNITASIPSATPTNSFNSSTTPELCPTAPILITVTEVATSVQIVTTTLVQTVTAGAEVSVSADAASAGASEDAAVPTVAEAPADIDASATTTDTAPESSGPAASDVDSRFRSSGTPATQAQIDAACADTSNIVINPNFAVSADGQVAGWSVNNTDPAITVGSEKAPSGNGTIAEFKSAVVGRTLAISQPLTLCPGQQYEISGLHRQAVTYAQCSVDYTVGGKSVLSVTPQTTWLEKSAFFTAGQGVDGASVDLRVTASCAGFSGFPVADQEGFMRVEVSGVNVVQQKDASKRSIVERLTGSWIKRTTSAEAAKQVKQQGFLRFAWSSQE